MDNNTFSSCGKCNKLLLVLFCIFLVAINLHLGKANGQPIVPAFFVFGDSIVDVGTNNYLNGSLAIANVPNYGIDFPNSTATGRFSNGYNLADFVAMHLGFENSPPPYLYLLSNISIFNETIQQGVNFASGGSGILNETGKPHWQVVVPLGDQIEQFAVVRQYLIAINGVDLTAKMLADSIFLFSVSSNDIFDHFLYNAKNLSQPELIDSLRSSYQTYLQEMYDMGARRFAMLGTAPVGCSPFARAINKTSGGAGGCLRKWNAVARIVNATISKVLVQMSSDLPDMKYSLADMYTMTKLLLKSYKIIGFTDIYNACCGDGLFNGQVMCIKSSDPNLQLCPNRDEYVFWDAFHPSQKATNYTSTFLFNGGPDIVQPISFSQLASA